MNQADLDDFRLSPLQIFFAKVAIVTSAILVCTYFTASLAISFMNTQTEQWKVLTGGTAFWGAAEQKLYTLADAPDIDPAKKQKILQALHQLSIKYKPYVDALSGGG